MVLWGSLKDTEIKAFCNRTHSFSFHSLRSQLGCCQEFRGPLTGYDTGGPSLSCISPSPQLSLLFFHHRDFSRNITVLGNLELYLWLDCLVKKDHVRNTNWRCCLPCTQTFFVQYPALQGTSLIRNKKTDISYHLLEGLSSQRSWPEVRTDIWQECRGRAVQGRPFFIKDGEECTASSYVTRSRQEASNSPRTVTGHGTKWWIYVVS